jgi:hypothetical protein
MKARNSSATPPLNSKKSTGSLKKDENRAPGQEGSKPSVMHQSIQLLPLILLVIFSFFNLFWGRVGQLYPLSNAVTFAWEPTATHSMARLTSLHNVKYYVNPKRYINALDLHLIQTEEAVERQVYREMIDY